MSHIVRNKQDGWNGVVDYYSASALAAGQVVVQGTLVGVTTTAIAAGGYGSLQIAGVMEFPKATTSGSAITAGAKVYWDSTNEVVTTTSDGSTYVGKAIAAAGDDDATVLVSLEQ